MEIHTHKSRCAVLPSCFMGAGASAEKTDELLAEFRKADTDGNGDISLEELKAIHKREDGDTYDEAKVEAEFEKLDKNHDGRVQVSEYLESAGVKKKVAREIDQTEAVMRAVGDETLNAAHEEHERRAAGVVSQTGWERVATPGKGPRKEHSR